MAAKTKNKKKKVSTDEISAAASLDLFETFLQDVRQNPDQVVVKESSGLGLKLYEEIEDKDGHVASVIQTRKSAVIGKEWGVDPASDKREDKKRAEFVQLVFSEMNFDRARRDALDALMKGFAVLEEIWEVRDGRFWIKEFKHRKPWRFVFGKAGELRMLTEAESFNGVEVPRNKFWIHTFQPRYGNPYGKGLGQKLFWPYWFKKHNVKWWANFSEKFGGPTGVGKYPPGTPKDKQEKLLEVIRSIQQETGVVIPSDMEVAFLEAERRGTFETYFKFITWCEDLQSKIVLGQTLTTQAGEKGARSLGEVHDDVRMDILKDDADDLSESINNGPVKRLIDFNFGDTQDYPKFWIRTEKEQDLQPLAKRDKVLLDIGYRVTQEYVEETYGVEVTPVQSPPPPNTPPAPGAPSAEDPEFAEDDDDALSDFIERLTRDARMDPFVDQITAILGKSETLEEFRDGLLAEFSEQSVADMAGLVEQGLLAAELSGRFESLPDKDKE